jgi:hypothetical protein
MSLVNCSECGNIMVDNPAKMCPNCIRQEELAEDKVSEYLRENNRKASVEDISRETGVKTKVIFRMLQRGRLESLGVEISYPCENCRSPILHGRLCDNCSKNLVRQFKPEEWKPQEKQESAKRDEQMYTRNLLHRK